MTQRTGIAWTQDTWNPVVGCSLESPGCTNCYAMGEAERIDRMQRAGGLPEERRKYAGLTRATKAGPVWTGKLRLWERVLADPLHRRAPTMFFVNSMSDLAHEDMPAEWFARIWAVMAEAHQRGLGHVFQVLTKRPGNLRRLLDVIGVRDPVPGIWLGVSAEDERRWDKRVPILRDIPAVIRWVSVEPQLSCMDRDPAGLDWIVQGGESGANSRLFDLAWARLMRERCRAAGTAFFMKQLGAAPVDEGRPYRVRDRKGADPAEWPADLHVREWPASRSVTAPQRGKAAGQILLPIA